MYYLFLVPLLFALVIVVRAVAVPSPHVRIAPLEEGTVPPALLTDTGTPAAELSEDPCTDGIDTPDLLPSQEEKQTLLTCAARYAPDAFESFIDISYPALSRTATVGTIERSPYLEITVDTDLLPVLCAVQMDVPDAFVNTDIRNPFLFCEGQFDGQYRAIAMLDALEHVLSQGGQLKRGLILLFVHSEEDLPAVLQELQARHEAYACVLCEGGHIAPFGRNQKNRIAAVGVGTRTHAQFQMCSVSDDCRGAQSSDSALHVLAQAVLFLEDPPLRAHLDSANRLFAKSALYENGLFSRIMAVNPRIFAPIVLKILRKWCGEGSVRDQVIVTALHAEHTDRPAHIHVIESSAEIDCILAPHSSLTRIEKQLRRRIRDKRIALKLIASDTPHIYADVQSFGYKAVQKAIALSFPNTNAAPVVMISAPLAKALRPLCTCTLAFSPYGDDFGATAQYTFFENFFLQLC